MLEAHHQCATAHQLKTTELDVWRQYYIVRISHNASTLI